MLPQLPHFCIKIVVGGGIYNKVTGGLFFIFGLNFRAKHLNLHLVFITPIIYDFNHYKMGDPEYARLFVQFTRSIALFGVLYYFLEMNISMQRRIEEMTRRDSTEKGNGMCMGYYYYYYYTPPVILMIF